MVEDHPSCGKATLVSRQDCDSPHAARAVTLETPARSCGRTSRVGTSGTRRPGPAARSCRRHDARNLCRQLERHASRLSRARRAVQALRPGGWLLLEDADPALQPLLCPDESSRTASRQPAAVGFRTLMAVRGADLAYGRTLPRVLREAGLDDVKADAYFPITSPACAVLEDATVRQIRHRLVGNGIATDEKIDRHLANVATGRLDLATAPMISAWGRRPSRGDDRVGRQRFPDRHP